MKQTLCIFALFAVLSMSIFIYSAATADDYVLELLKLDEDIYEDGETVYLDSYDEYKDVIDSMDEQKDYEVLYENQVRESIVEYTQGEREPIYKAKVIEATEPETLYGVDNTAVYYNAEAESVYYKLTQQRISVRILEGEHKDEVYEDIGYFLTGDIYENIKFPELKVGDNINVAIIMGEDGAMYAYADLADVIYARWGCILVLILIAGFLMILYAGKHGGLALILMVLIVDLILMVGIPVILNGLNVYLVLAIIVINLAIAISTIKLKLKTKTFVAIWSSLVICFLTIILMGVFDGFANMSGMSLEVKSFSENIPQRNVDIHGLNIAITTLAVFFATIALICKTVNVYCENKNKEDAMNLTTNAMKEHLGDNILSISAVLLVITIPKYMLLVLTKYATNEILNSEFFMNDIVRILFVIVAMAVSVPITILLSKAMIEKDEED